ncbi:MULTISPECIES: diguanylate cyclase [Pseudoxanthomonas]|uniref:diguanylate cyclase n=1 Tax=Pseudoxanthomonas TaxID=83618 RepID=UPI00161460F4|nr:MULTISPECIES: diguanylate cyclase [Pseudoxanthomonas]MBB3277242.1 diguanylate cyclase [Pseudoxanthomonas sp. OG2]MBD9376448.1 diguanylate cyclase [Pseudoxanthomonas sp. PXM04]MBV7474007.1 diguanylate cyclase [Pseudoxanthomonas sp. PXM05]UBB26408.1 diguanylate cyclase [Pseudoxanthomonas japonensis]
MPLERANRIDEQTRSRFGFRTYRMRVLGLGLGTLCVGAVLHEHGDGPGLWLLLLFNGLVWPHLAYWRVRRSADPINDEYRNLTFDAAMGGFWVAAMRFDALPSALLAVMLTMDKVIIGGPRFGARTLGAMVLTCLAASAAWGFAFEPRTSYPVVLACLPFLAIYPMAIGFATHAISRKAQQHKDLLEKMARFDAATGLMNRQQWLYAVSVELNRYQRARRPAVLVLIDIDHFKQINDTRGHTIGDGVVEEFARLMKACLRDADTGGRYGGDEFGIVMPETQWEDAIVAAERLRRQVAAYAFTRDGLRCTVSIGLAEISPSMATVSDWIDAADRGLYQAKRKGRDCIVVG